MLAKYNVETPQGTSRQDNALKASIEFLDHLCGLYPRCRLKVRFWDDTIWNRGKSPFTLVLKHPGALRSMFLSPSELRLGECYIFNDFDIEGDAEAACELADYLLSNRTRLGERLYLATILGRLPANGRPRAVPRHLRLRGTRHSPERDRQAISYHYDLPPSFYSLFLDARMLYSCAYFRTPEDGLEQAQQQKLDYICRKLRLSPGECLLDIGCGWGGLIIYAASRYQVKALGITLSTEQAEFARKQIRELGLEGRCQVELSDYRQFKPNRLFDKITSIGMFEHVGEDLLPEYFNRVCRLLRPAGIFLNSGIASSPTYRRQGDSFADHYVFPDGELVPVSTATRAAESTGFEVLDVENLREHYALTLHHWVQRLEKHANDARFLTDDTTYRIWRIYMAGSAHAFRTGRLGLYQGLFVKAQHQPQSFSLTRESWYAAEPVHSNKQPLQMGENWSKEPLVPRTGATSVERSFLMKHNADPNDNLPMTAAELDHRIRCRAYELYEQRGRSDGSDLEDWLRAEAELKRSANMQRAA